jgi:hypothetical protein
MVLAAVPGVGRAGPASPGGGFVITCNYSHTLPDDPIVDPGMPGKSHSHDFFGNTSTNARSNYATMIASPTTCALKDDTAGYWVPTPSLAGRPFHPHGGLGDIRVYYRDAGAGRVEPIPPDLELIGGDHMATKPLPLSEVRWYCGAGGGATTPVRNHPYDCTPYARRYKFVDGVVGWVFMPRCWDGRGLAPTDVVYPNPGTTATCPAGYGHILPQVSERVHFGIMDPCAGAKPCGPYTGAGNVVLAVASGPYYTMHADFWNTWQPATLDVLVAKCLDEHVHCGFQRTKYGVAVAVNGTGRGTVTSSPHGLTCSSVCSRDFGDGSTVRFTATPARGSRFIGWGGACTGTKARCTVKVDGAKAVTAAFRQRG